MKHVAIVGAGFSGVAVAIHLARTLDGPAVVRLISRNGSIGQGLAYGTPSPHHLLNVPAGRMGVDPQQEAGFIDYLHGIGLPFGAGDFVPRSLFAAYLEHAFHAARAAGFARGVELRVERGTIVDIQRAADDKLALTGDDGRQSTADAVVLALGNFPSQPPPVPGVDWAQEGLHASPWGHLHCDDPQGEVLLLGSGLTAFDALLQLRHVGVRGKVTMLSRRGLVAQPHRRLESPPPQGVVPEDALLRAAGVRAMLRELRGLVDGAVAAGHDWRDVIGGLRGRTPRLWQQLSEADRRRFLRHLAPYWDTHRHRTAVAIGTAVRDEIARGTLQVQAGRLLALERTADRWRVTYRQRGRQENSAVDVALVINCTGPSSDLRRVDDPLIRSLLAAGVLVPDRLGLGLRTDGYRIVDADARANPSLFYVGPLLKADLWEATAVPELRTHAMQAARAIAQRLARP